MRAKLIIINIDSHGGLVVNLLTFYTDDPSFNPDEDFSVKGRKSI